MKFFLKFLTILLLLSGMLLVAESAVNPLEDFEMFSATRAFTRRAEELINEEDYKGAAKQYRQAAKIQSDEAKRAEYLYLEAQNLLHAKKDHDALEAYSNLLEEHLYNIPLEHVLEQLRELAGNFERGEGTFLGIKDARTGIDIYKLIIKYEPAIQQSLDDRLTLAGKLEAYGKLDEAVNAYQEIIKLLPNDPNTRYGLAKVLQKIARKGDSDGSIGRAAVREAKRFLEVADKDDPRRPEIDQLFEETKNREAARLLKRAEFYLVKYHYKPEVARRYLIDLLKKYDDTPAGQRAKELLEFHFPEIEEEPQSEEEVINTPALQDENSSATEMICIYTEE